MKILDQVLFHSYVDLCSKKYINRDKLTLLQRNEIAKKLSKSSLKKKLVWKGRFCYIAWNFLKRSVTSPLVPGVFSVSLSIFFFSTSGLRIWQVILDNLGNILASSHNAQIWGTSFSICRQNNDTGVAARLCTWSHGWIKNRFSFEMINREKKAEVVFQPPLVS